MYERIKQLREEAELSQAELATELGIGQSTLGNYERGERVPDADLIVKIARYFNVRSDYVLGLSEYRTLDEAVKYQTILHIEESIEIPNEYKSQIIDIVNALHLLVMLSYVAVDQNMVFNGKRVHKSGNLNSVDPIIAAFNSLIILVNEAISANPEAFSIYTKDFNDKKNDLNVCIDEILANILNNAFNGMTSFSTSMLKAALHEQPISTLRNDPTFYMQFHDVYQSEFASLHRILKTRPEYFERIQKYYKGYKEESEKGLLFLQYHDIFADDDTSPANG